MLQIFKKSSNMLPKIHFWLLSCNDLRRIHFLVSLELLLVPVWKNRNGTIFSCFERKVVCTTKIPFNKVHFMEKKISNLWKKILNVCSTLYWSISLSNFFQSAEVAVKYVNNANVTLPLFLKNCREKKVYIY